MADLRTEYLGLKLNNPLIVGASGLTADVDVIQRLEEAGAGAVVVRSLFEEEIQAQRFRFDESLSIHDNRSPEMITVMPHNLEHAGPEEHLVWVRRVVESVSVPVIASLNAVNAETWEEYAAKLEQTGVRALELNFYTSPGEGRREAADIERDHIAAATRVVAAVRVPVSVKLSPFYTSPINLIRRLAREGIRGMVLFNGLLQPTIDIESQTLISPFDSAERNDNRLALRIIGLTYGAISADLCAGGGIGSGSDMVRVILAGASAVQVVSALYNQGIGHVGAMLNELGNWTERKGYSSIADFRGKLSRQSSRAAWVYDRAQYAKLLIDADGQIPSGKVL